MQIVPLSAVPAQNLTIQLGGQAVQLSLYLLGTGSVEALYMDLIANGAQILTARIARAYGAIPNTAAAFMLLGRTYLGFLGDFLFLDTQASESEPTADPLPAGLGTRWQLLYFSQADLAAAGLVKT